MSVPGDAMHHEMAPTPSRAFFAVREQPPGMAAIADRIDDLRVMALANLCESAFVNALADELLAVLSELEAAP